VLHRARGHIYIEREREREREREQRERERDERDNDEREGDPSRLGGSKRRRSLHGAYLRDQF
jgi:hypothetical protein